MKIKKPRKLYPGMRKSLKGTISVWGGSHVGKKDCHAVLIIDSDEYSNIPNINITAKNAIQMRKEITTALAATCSNKILIDRENLTIENLGIHLNNSKFKTGNVSIRFGLKEKTATAVPINFVLDINYDNLKFLRDASQKALDLYAENFADKL